MKKQKLLPLILVIALMTGFLPVDTAYADSYDNTYDINSGSVSISVPGNYLISGTGTSTANGISVANGLGKVSITLENVAVNKSGRAFSIGSGTTVYLTLLGTNSLAGGDHNSCLDLPSGASLIITSVSTGSMTAKGGENGVGIGGHDVTCGTLTINGGTVTAIGGYRAAGIGSSALYGGGGVITVNGGNVTATGGSEGAGIGGGQAGNGGSLTVNGGIVTATGGSGAAGIGGGCGTNGGDGKNYSYDDEGDGGNGSKGGDCGTVTINGGIVTANGSNGGAGIGGGSGGSGGRGGNSTDSFGGNGGSGGSGGSGGTITINGGTVFAGIRGGSGGGGGSGGTGYDYSGSTGSTGSTGSAGSCKITNGSVKASTMAAIPTNGINTVYQTMITGFPANVAVVYTIDGSNPTSCMTDSGGSLYLWRPATGSSSTVLINCAGTYYSATGTVVAGSNTFAASAVSVTAVSGVTVTPDTATLAHGDTLNLTATISPADATDKSVTWSSSNPDVAAVSNTGAVTVVSGGTATITATSTDGSFTDTCTITVNAATPTISLNPTDAAVNAGEGATLSVTASVSAGTLSYQWYINTSNSNTGGTAISGATGSSYSPSTAAGGTTYYYCIVKNTFGEAIASATSSVANITVNTAAAPIISTSPDDATVTQGDAATLSIAASTTSGALSYQWYRNTSNSNSGGTTISGATGTSYSPSTSSSGTTYYYCIVTSTLGTSSATTASNTASVTVNDPPPTVTSVTITPPTAAVLQGNTQTFNAVVTGTHSPAQTVTWIVSGGAVGTSIDNTGKLTVASGETASTLTVTAISTVDNTKSGTATVTVTAQTYALSIAAGTGGSITTGNSGNYATGTIINIAAIPSANYSFNVWSSTGGGSFGSTTSAGTSFTMPATAASITANFIYSGTSGSNGGNGKSKNSTAGMGNTYTANIIVKGAAGNNITNTTLAADVDQKTETAVLSLGTQQGNIMAEGAKVSISVPTITGVTAYTLGIPVAYLALTDGTGTLTFNSDTGSISLPANMLAGIAGAEGKKASITIGQGDRSGLSEAAKKAIGDRPLIELAVSIDGKQTEWNNPNAPVTISIPYKPTEAELVNPESIVVWYIDGNGNAVSVPNGHYYSATGTVTFTTTHFSCYAVGYSKVSFKDVAEKAWYSDAVSFLAARGITTGTGDGNFEPGAKLTRGQFLVMVMKAYDIAADTNVSGNFADAGNTYYTGYLAAAKRLGISGGVGGNMFAPSKEITRQEMFSLLYNTLKAIDKLPEGKSGNTLSAFSDAGQIATWATDAMGLMVETGTISGSSGKLSPTGATTRAEMAQVLYNLML